MRDIHSSVAETTTPELPSPVDLLDWLSLSLISGVGPRTLKSLLDHFGTPAAVLDAPASALRKVQGVGPKLSREIVAAREKIDAAAELALCRQHSVNVLIPADPAYPRMLTEIHDPPSVLFVRGEMKPADMLAVAIVGSRHATHYGTTQAERLAGSLARAGLTIISGLARGIDGAAHRGALEAGGRTLAVLGGGVLEIYPPEHKELAEQVIAQGAVISEAPPRAVPMSGSFPQRNRIISGLALGMLTLLNQELRLPGRTRNSGPCRAFPPVGTQGRPGRGLSRAHFATEPERTSQRPRRAAKPPLRPSLDRGPVSAWESPRGSSLARPAAA